MPSTRPTAVPPDHAGTPRPAGNAAPSRLPPALGDQMAPQWALRSQPQPGAQEIRFLRGSADAPRPFEERAAAPRAYSGDYWGAFSLEKFADVGGLSYTHEDAGGWLAYLQSFHPANFWYKDANVKPWAYYEQYDNWLDTYGIDAALAVYHSGHGGMDGAGKFYLPLGADWGGLGTTATSDQMRLGNEQVNYVFFSTCESLRVLDGHTPIRTWAAANLGFRMLFGFETVSWDDPNYGTYFWREWNKGKSLSTAWLDASWAIAHDQAPSAVACGASAAEAQNRLYNERLLAWAHVSSEWWWWRWYTSASAAVAQREVNRGPPQQLLVAELVPREREDPAAVGRVVEQLGLPIRIPTEISTTRDGSFVVGEGSTRLAFGGDGSFEAQLGSPNFFNRVRLDLGDATSIARDAVRRYTMDSETPLVFDRVRLSAEGGGSSGGTGQLEGPYVIGTTVQFRQTINGVPVITPGAGEVRVTVDNDGTVTSVQSSVRKVAALHDRPRNTGATPSDEGALARLKGDAPETIERKLSDSWRERLASWVVRGNVPAQYTIVPGTTEIGYDVRGNQAIIVARRAIEVDFGRGFRKRYWVTTPIIE